MDSTPRIAPAVGFTAAFIATGVYFSSSQMTLPILYTLPVSASTAFFKQLYYRGGAVVAPLGIIAATSLATAAYNEPAKRQQYAVAAVLALLPGMIFTPLVMMGGINQLLELASNDAVREKATTAEVFGLFRNWYWQNFARAGMAGAGGIIGLLTFLGKL